MGVLSSKLIVAVHQKNLIWTKPLVLLVRPARFERATYGFEVCFKLFSFICICS